MLTTDVAGPEVTDRLNRANLEGLYPNQDVLITHRVTRSGVSVELLRKLPTLIYWADVVHLTGIYSFPTIPTLLICRALHKPVIWSPHGAVQDADEWGGTRHKRLKRLWEIICNIIIAPGMVVTHVITERERVPTQARIPKAKAVIVPNGVDVPNSIPERSWIPDGKFRLMYLGRLSPKKGIENLIQALGLLNDRNVVLTIYGTGDSGHTTALKTLADEIGLLGTTISFAGEVGGAEKEAAFNCADVCVIPSHTECFCMVVAEALAHGVPVIASRGTPWEEVEEKGCGLWVGNGPESLAQAIVRIRSMELSEMGQRGRDWMKREFSWDSVASEMMDVYRSFI